MAVRLLKQLAKWLLCRWYLLFAAPSSFIYFSSAPLQRLVWQFVGNRFPPSSSSSSSTLSFFSGAASNSTTTVAQLCVACAHVSLSFAVVVVVSWFVCLLSQVLLFIICRSSRIAKILHLLLCAPRNCLRKFKLSTVLKTFTMPIVCVFENVHSSTRSTMRNCWAKIIIVDNCTVYIGRSFGFGIRIGCHWLWDCLKQFGTLFVSDNTRLVERQQWRQWSLQTDAVHTQTQRVETKRNGPNVV